MRVSVFSLSERTGDSEANLPEQTVNLAYQWFISKDYKIGICYATFVENKKVDGMLRK